MYKALSERIKQGYKTTDFPNTAPLLSKRYKGGPTVQCREKECRICMDVCPVDALSFLEKIQLDVGRCIFCAECAKTCPDQKIVFSDDFRMAVLQREHLVVAENHIKLANTAKSTIYKLFKRSLKLRVVSAGGCNGCESDINVLSTIGFDLGRFGVQVVASPRHADGLIVTGPVTTHMESALQKTYEAIPEPKIVIAVGACAISGGLFRGHPEQKNGVDTLLPVDLFIPGCPPNPYTILDGILRLLDKIPHAS